MRTLRCILLIAVSAACSKSASTTKTVTNPNTDICNPYPDTLCAANQTQWVTPLPIPPTYIAGTNSSYPGADYYEIHVTQFQHAFGLVKAASSTPAYTTVWGYGQVGQTYDEGVIDPNTNQSIKQTGSFLAPTLVATRGKPVVVKWIDDRTNPDGTPLTTHLFEYAYDTTIDGAMNGEAHVRMITHLHGAEVPVSSDGYPLNWVTPDPAGLANGTGGPGGNSFIFTYPNKQPAATMWYHDHSMGITRLNVMAMGAGFYLLKDPNQEASLNLPSGAYEIPLLISDRMFDNSGAMSFLNDVNAPGNQYHPLWSPEFFGNIITVNGKAWPYLNVEPRKYRFRILNASNARMYNLRLTNLATNQLYPNIWQIGSDGGYLNQPVQLAMTPVDVANDATDTSTKLFLAPAERADIVIDFSGLATGTTLAFLNDAPAPFPGGDEPQAPSTGAVLHFNVVGLTNADTSQLPTTLTSASTRIDPGEANTTRRLALSEVEDPDTDSPVIGLLNNTCFGSPLTENPKLGTTEIWEIANTTNDTHPIHIHLVQFNLLNRQLFDKNGYLTAWGGAATTDDVNPPYPTCSAMADPIGVTTNAQNILDANQFLQGSIIDAPPQEAGWKDTVRVKAGTVTRFLVRFKPQDPNENGPYGGYSFDPTVGNYVWHCHILDHEDNGMMRPYTLSN